MSSESQTPLPLFELSSPPDEDDSSEENIYWRIALSVYIASQIFYPILPGLDAVVYGLAALYAIFAYIPDSWMSDWQKWAIQYAVAWPLVFGPLHLLATVVDIDSLNGVLYFAVDVVALYLTLLILAHFVVMTALIAIEWGPHNREEDGVWAERFVAWLPASRLTSGISPHTMRTVVPFILALAFGEVAVAGSTILFVQSGEGVGGRIAFGLFSAVGVPATAYIIRTVPDNINHNLPDLGLVGQVVSMQWFYGATMLFAFFIFPATQVFVAGHMNMPVQTAGYAAFGVYFCWIMFYLLAVASSTLEGCFEDNAEEESKEKAKKKDSEAKKEEEELGMKEKKPTQKHSDGAKQ
ncbi:hypothetical protein MKEN_01149200 [Mycena kentingensis (nom. inval.)]|nr:hypothetical protein MKEN_01149200 [Mycena kentingensis (nom. inval.)]